LELEIIWGCAVSFCLAGIVYIIAAALEMTGAKLFDEERENEPVKITAAALGREIANNHGSFQERYYLRALELSGKISGIRIIPSSNNRSKQQVILDGAICCEFNEVHDELHKGMDVEICGLCMGKILTGCEVSRL
jgi:hypothetical protein